MTKETLTDTIAELDRTFVRDSEAEGDWSVQPSERYELGAIVGSGAQGDVLRAVDRVLGREVALKALRQDGIDLDVGNFIREARLMAQIGHPNIMPIYDAGLLPDGRLFYTMPLLEQRTLAEVIVQIEAFDDMPLVRRMRLFANACTAVHEAHLKGVFHRDLKPHNMIVGPSGELLVTDFGLARREDEVVEREDETGPIGTPLYMSPEQARGEPGNVASDVYSLGAILFELLTLKRPIEKQNIVKQLVAVLHDDPPLAHEMSPTVPVDLSELANRCLSKDPAERPPSALALVEGIEGWLEGRFEEERRRQECRKRVEHAQERLGVAQRLGSAIGALEAQLTTMRETTPEHAPLEVKQPLWEIEGNIERLVLERDEAEEAAVTSLELALRARPNDATASSAWIDVQLRRRQRLLDAGHVVLARRAAARAIRVGGDVLEHQLYGEGRSVGPDRSPGLTRTVRASRRRSVNRVRRCRPNRRWTFRPARIACVHTSPEQTCSCRSPSTPARPSPSGFIPACRAGCPTASRSSTQDRRVSAGIETRCTPSRSAPSSFTVSGWRDVP